MTKRIEQLRSKYERLKLELQTSVLEMQVKRVQSIKTGGRRNYEGASRKERLQGWKTPPGSGPNTVLRPALRLLRERSRDLVRNNALGESAASVMVSGIVGSGITLSLKNKRLETLWKQWAETTQCDATRQSNLTGLQTLAARAWAENGEVLFRRVIRNDWKPGEIPFAIQLLEPDYLDDTLAFSDDYRLGVKVDEYGAPLAYRLFSRHPFENDIVGVKSLANQSSDFSVADIGHLYLRRRIGQLRGTPPLTPVIVRMRDSDEYEDAQLVRQKLAACFMAFVTNLDDEGDPKYKPDDPLETFEPGLVHKLGIGEEVQFANPPGVTGYSEYTSGIKHTIAAGVGIPYEELTGDYEKVSWSSGRLARLKFYGNLDVWQWQMFIPQFCDKVFSWFRDGAAMLGVPCRNALPVWTAPRIRSRLYSGAV